MLHALIGPNNEIIRIEDNIDPNVGTKAGYYWLPVNDISRPSYNSNLYVAKQVVTITEDAVVRDWELRDKTQDEINDDKMNIVNNIDNLVLNTLLSLENRMRSINNENNINIDEYKLLLRDSINV